MENKISKDIELQLKVRSSTENVKTLEGITTVIVDSLKDLQLALVEKNVSVNRTSEKTLITISVSLQSS